MLNSTSALTLLLVILFPCLALSATIVVDSSDDYAIGTPSAQCSLRGAILNANAGSQVDANCAAGSVGLDEIHITVPSISLTQLPAGDDVGMSGDLDITEAVTIVSQVNGGTTFDAGQLDRHIEIFGISLVNIENVIFQNGRDLLSDSLVAKAVGGSIVAVDPLASLRLTSCSFLSNVANLDQSTADVKVAGAVLTTGQLTLTDVIFDGNTVEGNIVSNSRGGAAAASFADDLAINNVSLFNNEITASAGSATGIELSGGIAVFGVDAEIVGNFAAQNNVGLQGGCFYLSAASGRFDGIATDDIVLNTATTGGFIDARGIGRVEIDMAGFDISGNTASFGGAIHVLAAEQEVTVMDAGDIVDNFAFVNGGVAYGINTRWVRLYDQNSVSRNGAGGSGGVIYAESSDAEIRGGVVSDNFVSDNGGVLYVDTQKNIGMSGTLLTNVDGILRNEARGFTSDGGVIWASNTDVTIQNTGGDITGNIAARGGVAFLNQGLISGITITNVSGEIFSNEAASADGAGGVIWATDASVVIEDVDGGINDNSADNGDGGVVWASGGDVTISDISGGIAGQFAFDGGLIALLGPFNAVLTRVVGDIADNTGFFDGGLLHCSQGASCTVDNVQGSITETLCKQGGVIYCEDNVATLTNISGDISFNEAFSAGGVIHAPDIIVTDVQGIILDNEAVNENGGAFYGSSPGGTIRLERINGMNENFAKSGGGVYAEGDLIVNNVCEITGNDATASDGGFAIYFGTASVTNIGTLANNEPDNFFPFVSGIFELQPFQLTDIVITGFDGSGYTASVSVTGGTGGAPTISWSNGATGPTATGFTSPTISASARDVTQCQAATSFTFSPPVIAVTETASCPGAAIQIGGSPTATQDVPGPLLYSWSPAAPIVSGSTSANPTVGVTEDTTFTVIVSDSITGVSATADQFVAVATLDLTVATEALVCAGSSIQLGGSPTATGTPSSLTDPITYTWSPATGLDDPTLANPTLTTSTSGTYTVTARSVGCSTSNLEVTDSVVVTVLQNSIPFADATPGTSNVVGICAGGSITLGGDSVGAPGPLEYEWTPATGLDDPTARNPVASPSVTTTYTLRLYTLNRCSFDEDTVTVTVSDVAANAGSNIINSGVLGGFPVGTGGTAPYTYQWSPILGLSNSQAANPAVLPQAGSPYTVTVTDANGCTATDTVNVVVQNSETAGELDMSFTAANNAVLNLSQASQQLVFHISTALSVPSADVQVTDIDGDGRNFQAEVRVFTFSPRSGVALASEFVSLFGCDASDLPCTVPPGSSALEPNGFSALTFNRLTNEPGTVSIFTTYTFQTTDYSSDTDTSTSDSPDTSNSSDSSDTSDSSDSSDSSRFTSSSRVSSTSNSNSTDDDGNDDDDNNGGSSAGWALTPSLLLLALATLAICC